MIVKNCLIFGGSGQIGRNLIRKLSKNNYRVTVVTRNIHQKSYIIKTQANAGFIEIVEANVFDEKKIRDLFIKNALSNNLELTSHYETLHNSIAGKKFSISYSHLNKSSFFSKQLIRIPIHTDMNEKKIHFVIATLTKLLKTI